MLFQGSQCSENGIKPVQKNCNALTLPDYDKRDWIKFKTSTKSQSALVLDLEFRETSQNRKYFYSLLRETQHRTSVLEISSRERDRHNFCKSLR